jgi:hypothetical protein
MTGRNRKAVDATIATLRSLGRLEAVDEALVTAAQTLADAVDAEPGHASLWREYRSALNDLRGVGGSDDDDEFSKVLAALRPEVGDVEEPKAAKPRAKRGGGGRSARAAADAVADPDC